MTLAIGQAVQAEMTQASLVVRQKLGEGGQGTVYRVEGPHGTYALKWYNVEQATPEQRSAVRYLVQTGPPRGPAGRRFVWPEDVVTAAGTRQFGYLMRLIDMQRFADLGAIWARRRPAPSLPTLCEIGFQAANSYRALHLSGHCYRDIARGNLVFDPLAGDVLICDNDNVGVNRQSRAQVWGTLDYMAPELVRGEADPSTDTDLHSLAVLLFNLWVWHHPLHGEMEYRYHSWDLPAKVQVYGKDPVFVFDPADTRNRLPNDPAYATARRRWELCPPGLQTLFVRAFGAGLHEPARRVTEGEWQHLFRQLKDGTLPCPRCQAVNLWEPGQAAPTCWHCRQPLPLPPRLVVAHPAGKQQVLLARDARILRRHLAPLTADEEAETEIGCVVQHPTDPTIWGIRNLTDSPWEAVLPDGSRKAYAPQKAVPLRAGLRLTLGGTTAEIVP